MPKLSSTSSHHSPSHRNKNLTTWYKGIKRVMAYMNKHRNTNLTHSQVFLIIQMFFDLAFQSQMRGYKDTWPERRRRLELHIIKYVGKPKGKKNLASLGFYYPKEYLGYEFIIEPEGDRFINYGYEFVPDFHIRKAIVEFIDNNPEIAEKLMP